MKHARIQLLAMMFILTLMVAPQAFAAFTFTPLDVPFPGAVNTYPSTINNAGQIVGSWDDGGFDSHGFLRDTNGNFTSFDFPGAFLTFGDGFTNDGQIKGSYYDVNFNGGAFLLDKKGNFTLESPSPPPIIDGNVFTGFTGINTSGTRVGVTETPVVNNFYYILGFVMDKQGNFATFGYPDPWGYTWANAINDSGQVVGYYISRVVQNNIAQLVPHGFLRDKNGTFTAIDFPGAMGTFALKINDAGQIVGYYFNADFVFHSFLRDKDGTFTTIDFPGAMGTFAFDINDAGQILGSYYGADFVTHGFLATLSVNGAAADTVSEVQQIDVPLRTQGITSSRRPTGARPGLFLPPGAALKGMPTMQGPFGLDPRAR